MRKIMIIILILGIIPMLMGASSPSSSSSSSSSRRSAPTPRASVPPPGVQEHPIYIAAQKAMKARDYQRAIVLLKKVDRIHRRNANVHNLLGYSYRQMKNYKLSLQHYQNALNMNPRHRGANEYLGELYLQTGKLAQAENRLRILKRLCFYGCTEYDDLKKAIITYKKKKGLR